MISRSNIAVPLSALALNQQVIPDNLSDDASFDLLRGLALVQNAVSRLEAQNTDLLLAGQQLIIPWLERCYRDALYIRSHRVSASTLDTRVISRFGRLL